MNIEAKKTELMSTFHFRHATKEFDLTRKITNEDFEFILEAGRLSPSSGGNEPWKFLVVQTPEFRKELAPHVTGAVRSLPTASHFVIILARKGLTFDSPYVVEQQTKVKKMPVHVYNSMRDAYAQFYGDLKLDTERALLDWSSKQTYLAMGNMMTAAAHINIDSCPIEGFDLDAVNELLEKKGLLGNNEFGLSVMVAFGYRSKEPVRAKTRRPMQQLVQFV
ncbi:MULTISPECIES: NAD(P)H-dependent oxidoreductase [unclassified Paenibacillus]|uniref:NAD(P)H-dependent oxidoreductase n=1 Tax=unclassified Paenibacillus TaxID=185978 RepID=UPI00104F1ABC|nr:MULTISPECIES: NAD(P)H-dependent oxidoreductase [unclassified Paenibacillus]NIK68352.1 nitroreductase [Paenibacillus sp. BK720]TCM99360.1 nitroreductase [Paenibacillus sp. BK033]